MDLEQAIRTMSERSGVGLRAASRATGHVPTYINTLLTRGSRPRADVLQAIARSFGYALVLVPEGTEPPEGSIALDALDGQGASDPAAAPAPDGRAH